MSEVTKDKNSIGKAEENHNSPTDMAELTAETETAATTDVQNEETAVTDNISADELTATDAATDEVAATAADAIETIAVQLPTETEKQTESVEQPELAGYKKRSGFKYGCYLFVKRLFDILAAGILFLVLSPFILIFLLVKWLEDFHNPIYVSWRVGKDGKPFRLYKIRTMRVGAEDEKADLEAQGLNEADGPVFKIKNDPRITKVGKIYRKFSIDELLQLLNIINGTMSVVGPRPPIQSEVDQYKDWQKHRLDVKGGLLCLWQVQHNRNDLSFDEWVKLDLEYIQKQSIGLDLKIIFKGAYMVVFDHSGE